MTLRRQDTPFAVGSMGVVFGQLCGEKFWLSKEAREAEAAKEAAQRAETLRWQQEQQEAVNKRTQDIQDATQFLLTAAKNNDTSIRANKAKMEQMLELWKLNGFKYWGVIIPFLRTFDMKHFTSRMKEILCDFGFAERGPRRCRHCGK
jgi:hypothetical protein